MDTLIGLIYIIGVPAGLAAALGAALPSFMPRASLPKRTAVAAFVAGMLPMLLPISVIALTENDPVTLAVLVVLAVVVALLIGLPMALYVGRRYEPPPPLEKVFE